MDTKSISKSVNGRSSHKYFLEKISTSELDIMTKALSLLAESEDKDAPAAAEMAASLRRMKKSALEAGAQQ